MIGEEGLPTAQRRVLQVIVIKDNRQTHSVIPNDKGHVDFRSSAFKDTQVDPLQFQRNQFSYTQDQELISQLNRRIFDLEQRVQILEQKGRSDSEYEEDQKQSQRRKIRRRNCEMRRDKVCLHCGKRYGTETALKYHIKLKHLTQQQI